MLVPAAVGPGWSVRLCLAKAGWVREMSRSPFFHSRSSGAPAIRISQLAQISISYLSSGHGWMRFHDFITNFKAPQLISPCFLTRADTAEPFTEDAPCVNSDGARHLLPLDALQRRLNDPAIKVAISFKPL